MKGKREQRGCPTSREGLDTEEEELCEQKEAVARRFRIRTHQPGEGFRNPSPYDHLQNARTAGGGSAGPVYNKLVSRPRCCRHAPRTPVGKRWATPRGESGGGPIAAVLLRVGDYSLM
jgi:hypothetical protein